MTVELLYIMHTKNSTGDLRRAKKLAGRIRFENWKNLRLHTPESLKVKKFRFHTPEFLEVKKQEETFIELLHKVTVVATLDETDSDAAIERVKQLVRQAGARAPKQSELMGLEYERTEYVER